MPAIQVDARTAEKIEFAASLWRTTPGEVVKRLVESTTPLATEQHHELTLVPVHMLYAGQRFDGLFDATLGSMRITDGALAGTSATSPSAAAKLIVQHVNPEVSPNRNGWRTWIVTATGKPLESLK
jgi:hypothetical protein